MVDDYDEEYPVGSRGGIRRALGGASACGESFSLSSVAFQAIIRKESANLCKMFQQDLYRKLHHYLSSLRGVLTDKG